MSKVADLHGHTFFSDGTQSPQDVVDAAVKHQVDCIAITDHDVMDGVEPAAAYGQDKGVEVIPGVELSSNKHGRDIHILGYFSKVDPDSPVMQKILEMREVRVTRLHEMIKILNGLGIEDLSFEDVAVSTKTKSIGRPHLAQTLVNKGVVKDMKQAFDMYLAEDKPAYFPKFDLPTKDAIDLIKQSGGAAVLAHPMVTKVDEMVEDFVKYGLDGIEVYYANVGNNVIKKYEAMAEQFGLIKTGGSDNHGAVRPTSHVGKIKIDYALVDVLKSKINQ